MSNIILTIGLPASGKTTWALEQAKKFPDKYVIVCRDDLRAMHGGFNKKREKTVTEIQQAMAERAIGIGKDVIVADTNLNPKTVGMWKRFATENNAHLKTQSFLDVSVDTCIERDLKRGRPVGERVIREMYNRHLRKIEKPIVDIELPWVAIFDIDGTLANMEETGRGPYDWHRVGEDKVNEAVKALLHESIRKNLIFLFSGRDEVCREETENWLNGNGIAYDKLYMRPEGNMEKDVVIKKRLYEEHIRGKYNVRFVVDDRLQVCRLWYELGLPLFRFGDPDANF